MMIIMFIVMFLPLIALPVFWLLPLGQAIPLYAAGVLLSAWMFWLMRGNRRRPVVTGKESLIGREAEIISKPRDGSRAPYTLRVEGELWAARADNSIQRGDKVIITASEGNTLIVKLKDDTTKNER